MRNPLSLATGSFPGVSTLGVRRSENFLLLCLPLLPGGLGQKSLSPQTFTFLTCEMRACFCPIYVTGLLWANSWVSVYIFIHNKPCSHGSQETVFYLLFSIHPWHFPASVPSTLSGIPFHLLHLPKSDPPLKAQFKPRFLHVIIHYASRWKPFHPPQDPLFFALLIYFLAVFCFICGQELYLMCLVLP